MVKKKTCKNCGRVMAIIAAGLCGSCYFRSKKYTPGTPEYSEEMAKAKADLNNQYPRKSANTEINESIKSLIPKTQKEAESIPQKPPPEKRAEPEQPIVKPDPDTNKNISQKPRVADPIIRMHIFFNKDDREIYDGLVEMSKMHRRTTGQEILWLIDQAVRTWENGILHQGKI